MMTQNADEFRNSSVETANPSVAGPREAGWLLRGTSTLDFNPSPGVTVREHKIGIGLVDCFLFVDRSAVGRIEAKPDNRAYEFFQKNLGAEYSHGRPATDKMDVCNKIYLIEPQVTRSGNTFNTEQLDEKRGRETRPRQQTTLVGREEYSAPQLNRSVVTPEQTRTFVTTRHRRKSDNLMRHRVPHHRLCGQVPLMLRADPGYHR